MSGLRMHGTHRNREHGISRVAAPGDERLVPVQTSGRTNASGCRSRFALGPIGRCVRAGLGQKSESVAKSIYRALRMKFSAIFGLGKLSSTRTSSAPDLGDPTPDPPISTCVNVSPPKGGLIRL